MDLLKQYRIIGLLEGLSYVLLLCIAVPLKYLGGMDIGVRMLGLPHGLLFIAFIGYSFHYYEKQEWKASVLVHAILASLLPFGTLHFDYKVLRPLSEKKA